MGWLAKEWETQWPLIRFEFYRWGSALAATFLITIGARLLHGVFKIPDTYFYGALFVLAFICFMVFASSLSRTKEAQSSGTKQSTEALTQPLSGTLPPSVQQINDYYNSFDAQFARETEQQIRDEINKVPVGNERDVFTMRALVSTSMTWQLLEVWYNIYGSQIKALELLNTGMVKRDRIQPFYHAAAAGWPQTYALDTFDRWIGWLRTQGLIYEHMDEVGIATKGRALLTKMVRDGRTAAARPF